MFSRTKYVSLALVISIMASFLITAGFSHAPGGLRYAPEAGYSTFSQVQPEPTADFPFRDSKGHWAEAAIAEMYAKDVMKGYIDSSFRPKKPVSFLEAIVMFDRLLWGKPLDSDYDSGYLKDNFNIPEWSIGFVASALRNGFITWEELHRISLQQPLTRQMGAVLTIRALELTKQAKSKKSFTLPFTDSDKIDTELKPFVSLAYERRIFNGFPDGSFQPASPISRAETAVLLSTIAKQLPYINSKETTGFIKSVNPEENRFGLVSGEQKEIQVTLPSQYLVYRNNSATDLKTLLEGDNIRVISSPSKTLTVVIAHSVVPDSGTQTAIEAVNLSTSHPDIRQWVETNKTSENYLAGIFDGKLYILATRGEKKRGGYTVDIVKVSETANDKNIELKVWVERTDPALNAVTIEVINYPYKLVRVVLPDKPVNTVTFVDNFDNVISSYQI